MYKLQDPHLRFRFFVSAKIAGGCVFRNPAGVGMGWECGKVWPVRKAKAHWYLCKAPSSTLWFSNGAVCVCVCVRLWWGRGVGAPSAQEHTTKMQTQELPGGCIHTHCAAPWRCIAGFTLNECDCTAWTPCYTVSLPQIALKKYWSSLCFSTTLS